MIDMTSEPTKTYPVHCPYCDYRSVPFKTREQHERDRDEHLRVWHTEVYHRREARPGIVASYEILERMFRLGSRPSRARRSRGSASRAAKSAPRADARSAELAPRAASASRQ
jgi:hypothetical protein